MAPRHNPVDMPPQPEKRSSSVNSALSVSYLVLFSGEGKVAIAGRDSTKEGGGDTIFWTEISEVIRAIHLLKDWSILEG